MKGQREGDVKGDSQIYRLGTLVNGGAISRLEGSCARSRGRRRHRLKSEVQIN